MVEIDDARFPIVRVTWGESLEAADMERYLEAHAGWLARGGPVGIIHDAHALRWVPPEIRGMAVSFIEARDDDELARVESWVVHDSPLVRGVILAVRWLGRSRSHLDSVTSIDEAEARVRAFIDAATPGEASRASRGR